MLDGSVVSTGANKAEPLVFTPGMYERLFRAACAAPGSM